MKSVANSTVESAWQATLKRHARRRAMVEAASGEGCTFQALDTRARHWAEAHGALRFRNQAVVFATPNGVAWFEIFLGLLSVGAVPVPLDPGEPVEAQRRIVDHVRAGAWWQGGHLIPVKRARRFRDQSACLLKVTSGSTGGPRALVFSASQMLADARQVTRSMGIRASDLNLGLIPLGHSYGLGNLTFPLIAHGVPLVCGSSPLPQAIAADVALWRPSVFPTVPTVLRGLVSADLETGALAPLRTIITAGAPLAPEIARAFKARFGRPVHSFYGSSETGGIAYDRGGNASSAGRVGRAMDGVTITFSRGDRLEVVSRAVFTQGNRRRRGDRGAWLMPDRVLRNQSGELTLLGRRDTTVKLAGRRVSLAEISAQLRRIPGVRDVWVGVSETTEPTLGAAVVGNSAIADLRAAMGQTLPAWKVPRRWTLLPDLPLTARGKIDTRALQAAVFG